MDSKNIIYGRLRHQFPNINRFVFIFAFALFLYSKIDAGIFIIIVTVVFPLAFYQKVFFFVYQVLTVIFTHFKIGNKLYRIGRTSFFTVTTEYTA